MGKKQKSFPRFLKRREKAAATRTLAGLISSLMEEFSGQGGKKKRGGNWLGKIIRR